MIYLRDCYLCHWQNIGMSHRGGDEVVLIINYLCGFFPGLIKNVELIITISISVISL
jgi:hypothetical protein